MLVEFQKKIQNFIKRPTLLSNGVSVLGIHFQNIYTKSGTSDQISEQRVIDVLVKEMVE